MAPEVRGKPNFQRIMLVGNDRNQILRKRFQAAGWQVIGVNDGQSAIERARRECFNAALILSRQSPMSVAETIFNLRDLDGSMDIILLLDRPGKIPSRYLRQLVEHPIAGTRILTRRQLQRAVHGPTQVSLPGEKIPAAVRQLDSARHR